MKNTNVKRELVVLTDNVEKTEEIMCKSLSSSSGSIEYCEKIEFINIFNNPIIKNERYKLYTVIINDIMSIPHSLFINIIKLISDEVISFVYTNDKDEFDKCYERFTNTNDKDIHSSSIDDFIFRIQKEFTLPCYNIAIITDNDYFVKFFIIDMVEYASKNSYQFHYNNMDKHGYIDDNELKISINSPYMAKIIQQYIYNVWYGKHKCLRTDTVNDPTSSIIKNLLSVKISESNIINYHFIKPNHKLDISQYQKYFDFDKVYVDINTYYSSLILDKSCNNIPFSSRDINILLENTEEDNDYSKLLILFKNIIEYFDDNISVSKVKEFSMENISILIKNLTVEEMYKI